MIGIFIFYEYPAFKVIFNLYKNWDSSFVSGPPPPHVYPWLISLTRGMKGKPHYFDILQTFKSRATTKHDYPSFNIFWNISCAVAIDPLSNNQGASLFDIALKNIAYIEWKN